MTPTVRRATQEDLIAFYGQEQGASVTTKAWAGLLGDEVVSIGGFHFSGGLITAFLDIRSGEARRYKLTIFKTAQTVMRDAKAQGYRFVYADMDTDEPRAEKLLMILGFSRMAPDQTIFMWRGDQ